MPPGKNYDDVPQLIVEALEHNGIAPTPRLVESIRRVIVEVAAQEKSRITKTLIREYLIRVGILSK